MSFDNNIYSLEFKAKKTYIRLNKNWKYVKMGIEHDIKQQKFKSSRQKVMVNIIYTSNWVQSNVKAMLKPFGITHQQYNVLRILKGKYPDTSSASDIKNVMLDKTPDLTRLIDRLIKKDLVSREVCPTNRRKVDIAITESGVNILNQIIPTADPKLENLANLSEEEAEILSGLLDKMRTNDQ